MQIFGKLGIDPALLLAQILNFCLLLWLLSRFFYRPILKRIMQDEADLARAQTALKQFDAERNKLKLETAKTLKQAKEQARSIVEEAEAVARGIKKSSPTRNIGGRSNPASDGKADAEAV